MGSVKYKSGRGIFLHVHFIKVLPKSLFLDLVREAAKGFFLRDPKRKEEICGVSVIPFVVNKNPNHALVTQFHDPYYCSATMWMRFMSPEVKLNFQSFGYEV